MTAVNQKIITGAPSTDITAWNSICWDKPCETVRRLQIRIAKAIREKRFNKAKALQHLLTRSFHAKLLAVKRVTENQGSKTAGVDGVTWQSSTSKMRAVRSIKHRGYHPLPLKRIYIPKKKGKRPLGIPAMCDRAQQALHLLALEPIAETTADRNSYGFRPKRSCHDAIEQCFNALARRKSAQYILEGDIKSCFDHISHQWLVSNLPMNKSILEKWLTAGYMEKEVFHHTEEGTPQGGIISPTAANMVLDGMESLIKRITHSSDKANFIRYADDFVVTASSREVLEDKIKPAISRFLKERGLELSADKTNITHIDDGFDFLGFNVRKYHGKLLIRPAKQNVLSFLRGIRQLIKEHSSANASILIRKLNARVRGWANYYRHAVSKQTFSYVDHCIFWALWSWAKRRHPSKSQQWVRNKYFRYQGLQNCVFFAKIKTSVGGTRYLDLFYASSIPIRRHVKIRAEAIPYDPMFDTYFANRAKRVKLSARDSGPSKRYLPIF